MRSLTSLTLQRAVPAHEVFDAVQVTEDLVQHNLITAWVEGMGKGNAAAKSGPNGCLFLFLGGGSPMVAAAGSYICFNTLKGFTVMDEATFLMNYKCTGDTHEFKADM